MPGKVKVKILAGRRLPVMDRARDTCDAFVEVKLGSHSHKTDVFKHSLNPNWNSEWYRFEVDDENLQDEPLQIRVMDYDTYSANDAIGKVYIDLNPLLIPRAPSSFSGWFPIYDTMHGIRGELNVQVKVELFSDINKFRESSCGIQFFYSHSIPNGFRAQSILGFVEELVVNNDPEYQWIDKIRTPRASNEARQTLFIKLSGEVQRKIGLKALDLGGNAVIGYKQCFDLEGESGIVVRGIGTAVNLQKLMDSVSPRDAKELTLYEDVHSPASSSGKAQKYCSESDLSITPKGTAARQGIFQGLPPEGIGRMEYPFITMKIFGPNVIKSIGGFVAAKSVKLLTQINNPEEPETRDAWWIELRKEIRSHAKAFGCTSVIGYSESTNICDDVCILSASGTAVILHSSFVNPDIKVPVPTVIETPKSVEKPLKVDIQLANQREDDPNLNCRQCHLTYNEPNYSFQVPPKICRVCRKFKVPDFVYMTIDPPANLPFAGKGCLIQARVCRPKKDSKGEQTAKEISEGLPFMEYEIHKQLLNKLRLKGMNAICGLKMEVTVGEKTIVAFATGTGIHCIALPAPSPIKIICEQGSDVSRLAEIQKEVNSTLARNKELYFLKNIDTSDINSLSETEEELSDTLPDFDLSVENKDPSVLEIDDSMDVELINLLMEPPTPKGFEFCTTTTLPGGSRLTGQHQLFTRIFKLSTSSIPLTCLQLSSFIDQMLESLCVKLWRQAPCVISNLDFLIDSPEPDEIQFTLVGVALSCEKPLKHPSPIPDQELVFKMDEEEGLLMKSGSSGSAPEPQHIQYRTRELLREPFGIEMTPLNFIPGSTVERYLGNLNFFFIRESTSLKESGGLNGFLHSFVTEVLAIVRSHVAALGGNGVTSYHMNQCVLLHTPHKNTAQCLINVGGDAVHFTRIKIHSAHSS